MEDSNRFYWIRLKTDFYKTPAIDFLREQQNGYAYIALYQMLCLEAANSGGVLCSQVGEMTLPYDAEKLAKIMQFDVQTVRTALQLFERLALLRRAPDGMYQIEGMDDMVGSESKWAQKKRRQRTTEGDNVPPLSAPSEGQCPTRDKSIEFRDKSIELRDKSTREKNESLFSRFWQAYPRKTSKAQAEKAFLKLGVDETLLRGMLSALEWQCKDASWRKDGGKYIPYAASWLSGRRWEDEPDPAPANSAACQTSPAQLQAWEQQWLERVKTHVAREGDCCAPESPPKAAGHRESGKIKAAP